MIDDCAKMARTRVRRGREGALSAGGRLAVFAGAVGFGWFISASTPALESYQRYQEETGLPAWKSSLHFTVFARDQETAGKALDELEKTHRRVTEDLNLSKDMSKQCLVFIWPEKSEYIKRADQFHSGDIEATLGFFILGKGSEPALMYFYESDKMLKEVLPHELSHLILEIVLDPLQKYRIPLWLHEGFAQAHEEGDYRQNLLSVMVAQRRGKLLPLGRILTTRVYPNDSLSIRLFYLESEALVRFLLLSQSCPGEFFDFCTEVLFWKEDPEKILPKRFGGAFPVRGRPPPPRNLPETGDGRRVQGSSSLLRVGPRRTGTDEGGGSGMEPRRRAPSRG
ncbi:MAG: hypothetical protein NTV79_02385 [Candidatus Aureabacteria bacterium]|nr:hypothetical protein [Candidatus Auribacterota bacterium]